MWLRRSTVLQCGHQPDQAFVCQPSVVRWQRPQAAMQVPLAPAGANATKTMSPPSCQSKRSCRCPGPWHSAPVAGLPVGHMMSCSSMSRRWLPLARISCIVIGDIVNSNANLSRSHVKGSSEALERHAVHHEAEASCVGCKHVRRQAGRLSTCF